jgi:hypothetical protein
MKNEPTIESDEQPSVVAELMGFDKWPQGVAIAFNNAVHRTFLDHVKDKSVTYTTTVATFRAIENEFLKHFENNETNALEVRRIIAEYILEMSWYKNEPFETCQRCWNDLVQLGFYRIEREGLQTGVFAALCLSYRQIDLGLSVVEPLIAKFERLRAEPNLTDSAAEYYDEEIESFRKLRARLEAARG